MKGFLRTGLVLSEVPSIIKAGYGDEAVRWKSCTNLRVQSLMAKQALFGSQSL